MFNYLLNYPLQVTKADDGPLRRDRSGHGRIQTLIDVFDVVIKAAFQDQLVMVLHGHIVFADQSKLRWISCSTSEKRRCVQVEEELTDLGLSLHPPVVALHALH